MSEYKPGYHPNSRKNLLSKPPEGAARAGGLASVKARKELNFIGKVLKKTLHMEVPEEKVKQINRALGTNHKTMTAATAATIVQLAKAINDGDTNAYKAVVDTALKTISLQTDEEGLKVEVSGQISYVEALKKFEGEKF